VIPIWIWALLAGLLGLAIGSFLNVVIYRVPAGESIVSPPSRCPRCGNSIRGRHNVPVVGWLVLRGKCYDCGLPISPRYPVVEAVTGLAFAGVTIALLAAGLGLAVVPALVVTAVLITAVMIIVDGHPVPRPIALTGAIAVVVTLALTVVSVLH
jgi:leader peptidase (prepilin peptidase) / N-methyltransferase